MPRILFDAIDASWTKTLAHFSRDEILEGAAPVLRELVEVPRLFARRQREARSKGFTWQWEDEGLGLSALTMRAFARTGDPVWLVLAVGPQIQSLMSASFDFSPDAAAAGSCKPRALTKSRVS
jgi:hypothetical protein